MYKKQLELVEKILNNYPSECRKNYYENKDTLIIIEDEEEPTIKTIGGTYDEVDNIIKIYNSDSIFHELFHMCFRNKNNIDKKIFENKNIYFSNGVSYKIEKEDKTTYCGKGINEGFAEYLNRKINSSRGRAFEYFIVDLLISIYGEDILKYPLTNDINGFYSDERFFDIIRLRLALDQYYYCLEYFKLVKYLIVPITDNLKAEEKKDIMKNFDNNITKLYISIIDSIEAIIDEYKNCKNPLIEIEILKYKINNFLLNKDHQFDIEIPKLKKYDIEKDIQKIIKNLH